MSRVKLNNSTRQPVSRAIWDSYLPCSFLKLSICIFKFQIRNGQSASQSLKIFISVSHSLQNIPNLKITGKVTKSTKCDLSGFSNAGLAKSLLMLIKQNSAVLIIHASIMQNTYSAWKLLYNWSQHWIQAYFSIEQLQSNNIACQPQLQLAVRMKRALYFQRNQKSAKYTVTGIDEVRIN